MTFIPVFKIGATVENKEIISQFQCGNMGGMRRSKATNTLVIVSDHTKGLYEDKWLDDVLHYTGMGKNGDQDINFMQNKTLAESANNGVEVHLFEVLLEGQYIYRGPVDLAGQPYQENQKGENDILRKVWMFPVRLRLGNVPLSPEVFRAYEERKKRQAQRLSLQQLKQRAEGNQSMTVGMRSIKTANYVRDPYVSEYAKRLANGRCQLCDQEAPFLDEDKKPYLETHHVVWLSEGGPDIIDNTVALCPNCHRKMHILNRTEEKEYLTKKAKGI